jgi:eukaryotic-like serine/threonine-protein kinase
MSGGMTPERDADIERICPAALERDVAVRAAFLEEACAGDAALRREVESLLAQEPAAVGFLSTPAVGLAGGLMGDRASWVDRQLGPYILQARLGAGGMGEVYQAHDIKLGRDVAIKVLPEAFAHDLDRLSRFQREAKMLAALNHPSIATIYGLEESHGSSYLVMEIVSGETLQERLARKGRLAIGDALGICRQMAEALEAAHEKGIIHRDLKPANVKVTPEGKVKVLDFGLAKAFAGNGTTDEPAHSPTLSRAATAQGVILGTAAYMSPEQARSQVLDKRADMWAFGCVLYELLTGKQAFPGDTVTEILAGVLRGDPDWSSLPSATPTKVRDLLGRCLQKDKTLRMRDAGDACIEIQEALATPAIGSAAAGPASAGWRLRVMLGLAFLLAALLGGLAVWNLKPTSPAAPRPVSRFTITLPPGQQLVSLGFGQAVAISPDGTRLAYVASQEGRQQIYLRAMDGLDARPVPGTDGALEPFFSPDSQALGFFADGKLKKTSVNGGSADALVDASYPFGASWGSHGMIASAAQSLKPGALWQLSDGGDAPQPLTRLEKGEVAHVWPEFLPGGKAVLFVAGRRSPTNLQVAAQSVATGERRNLIPGGTQPRYAPSGHLIYVSYEFGGSGVLTAVPFDPRRISVTGAPVPVIDGVRLSATTVGAHYGFSATGSLVYVPGGAQAASRSLVSVDRQGRERPLSVPAHAYLHPRLSPDGERLAVTIKESGLNVWIDDLARDTVTRLTLQGFASSSARWRPDGQRIAFSSNMGDGQINLYWQLSDGSGGLERLTSSEYEQGPTSWSPDGQLLTFNEYHPTTGYDIWVLRMSDRKAEPFLRTPFNEASAEFSPDGRWLAYVSDESGRREVYVQPYPGPGRKSQISTDGGAEPVWNRNRRELFYRSENKVMAVDIATQPSFAVSKPHVLFEGAYMPAPGMVRNYDVFPDGRRFLMVKPTEPAQAAPTQINVVLNWFEELKQKVPVGLKK